jgi:hypothetical protein
MIFLALLAMAIGVLLVLALVLVGLVEAPWPVLLVGLLAALYGLQRELAESQAMPPDIAVANHSDPAEEKHHSPPSTATATESNSSSSDDGNILTYRGIRYSVAQPKPQKTSSHESEDLVEGVYRGHHWQRWQTDTAPDPHPPSQDSEITYRGHKVIKPQKES